MVHDPKVVVKAMNDELFPYYDTVGLAKCPPTSFPRKVWRRHRMITRKVEQRVKTFEAVELCVSEIGSG